MTASRSRMLNGMPSTQIAIRLEHALLAAIDEVVEVGDADSRADVVRTALATYLEQRRQAELDQAIVAGYRRIPSTTSEDAVALASLRSSIEEEPW